MTSSGVETLVPVWKLLHPRWVAQNPEQEGTSLILALQVF
jgi:hypothetical protein